MYCADRVRETSVTTGTGTISLAGTATGYQSFVDAVGSGAIVHYCIASRSASEWECGIGTVTDGSPDTLSRTTVLSSSNSGSAVAFTAGTKDVFLTVPAVLGGPFPAGLEVNATGSSGTPNVLAATESGTVISNEGSTLKVYHTLPTAVARLHYCFVVQSNNGVRITAGTGDTIRILTSASAAAGYAESTTVGSFVHLYAINATEWFAIATGGTWSLT